MQHQYWSLRRSVLRTLGGKEDECVVSSDAELDAKLELFRSISDSCGTLQRILDQYQERLCVLAQEESSLGKFLRDAGRGESHGGAGGGGGGGGGGGEGDAAARHMLAAGKAVSFSGQQRLTLRGPLMRLYHEPECTAKSAQVETWSGRAVSDTRATVADMERARGEYRAALSWMKAASAQLDPDTGRGLDKFRKAQRHVRQSKQIFDKLKLDVLQKIDLLAAARCNMFSHVLANYQSSFLSFAGKVHQTMVTTSVAMHLAPKYDFCILKELSQQPGEAEPEGQETEDRDQMLFFQDEYKDDDSESKETSAANRPSESAALLSEVDLLAPTGALVDAGPAPPAGDLNTDLAGLRMDCGDLLSNFGTFLPSQLLQDSSVLSLIPSSIATPTLDTEGDDSGLRKESAPKSSGDKPTAKKSDMAAWFKIFAELDPLANPDAIPGASTSQSHAA